MTTPRMHELVPGPETGQLRLDKWLAEAAGISRSQAKEAIGQGRLSLAGQPLKPSDRPQPGQTYLWQEAEEEAAGLIPEAGPLAILYEDPWLLVVSKTQGQLTHPVRPDDRSSLASALAAYTPLADLGDPLRPGIVHRLDKDTSGLLVVAKDREVGFALQAAIARKALDRRYVAIVQGRPSQRAFSLRHYLVKNKANPLKREVQEGPEGGGLWAQTHVHVLYYNRCYTVLSCALDTGRTHQIRAQLAASGLPVVGDPLYGQAKNPFGFKGQALHAHYLGFAHPITGDPIRVRAPIPDIFQRALQRIATDYRKEEGL